MTTRHLLWCAAAFAAILDAQTLNAPADAKHQVDQVFERYNKADSPGCAVGATIGKATVLSAGYGMADLEHNVAITPESIFEAGSVSKQFTAGAILLLAQQGKLSLDDPVRKYFPEVPDYGKPLTIRHMINHTSGLRDWGSVEGIAGWPRTTRTYTHANVLEIVSLQRALNYPPGAEYSYSNTGFNLAAMIVAKVSGKPFPQFTRDAIFSPLDMSSTQWRDDYQRIVKNRAIAYVQAGGSTRMLMPFENVYGNGGLLTTVGDLLRWNQNFTDAKVGGRAFVEAEHLQGRLTDGRTIAYAAGLMVLSYKGLREVSHSGSTAGYSAWLGRYPDQGLSVAVLCNVGTNATAFGHQVADVYLNTLDRERGSLRTVQVDDSVLQTRAGLYSSERDHLTRTVEAKDGNLLLDGRVILKPNSASVFSAVADGPRVEFETDPSGKVTRLRMASEMDGGTYFDKVEPAKPTTAELEAMAGTYSSDEAEVTLKVTVEQGGLVIHRRPDTKIPLKPTYRDAFQAPQLGSVRFIRNPRGRIIEMSIGEERVWDLRLRRTGVTAE